MDTQYVLDTISQEVFNLHNDIEFLDNITVYDKDPNNPI